MHTWLVTLRDGRCAEVSADSAVCRPPNVLEFWREEPGAGVAERNLVMVASFAAGWWAQVWRSDLGLVWSESAPAADNDTYVPGGF